MNIKELVKDKNIARFSFYRQGNLWYTVKDIPNGNYFRFPVPVSDTGNATFGMEERAIHLMRWIRKAIEENTIEEIRYLEA